MTTWGATAQEIQGAFPGDELVPNPVSQTTQAITIRAKPEQIYPWLLQIGVERGGMYSYDWLENLDEIHRGVRCKPELELSERGL
jgi:hypothetical protein